MGAAGPAPPFPASPREKGLWDEAYEKAVQDAATEFVEKAVAEAEARPAATPEDLFAYTYAAMPLELEAQLADLKAFLAEGRR